MKYILSQFIKFVIVGLIAFAIDYGLLILFTEVFGINYLISATISFIISVIFNYIASMRYIYTHKQQYSRKREFIVFCILAVIGLIINNVLLYMTVEIFGQDYKYMKLIAAVIVALWNFISRKVFLDAKNFEA